MMTKKVIMIEMSFVSVLWKNSARRILRVNSEMSFFNSSVSFLDGVGVNFRPFISMFFSVSVMFLEEMFIIFMSVFFSLHS